MAIEIVSAEDARTGRGGRTKGEKYTKYAVAVKKHISWIEEEIEKSKDHTIRIKNETMRKELGKEFEKLDPTSVYWGLKYVMFQEGIVVKGGKHRDGSELLIFRAANEEDRLPPSLSKYLETEDPSDEPVDETDEPALEEPE